MKTCKHCSGQIPDHSKFCPSCGKPAETSATCPYCAEEIPHDASVCPYCSEPLADNHKSGAARVCPYCAEEIPQDSAVCPYCSEPLHYSESATPEAAVPAPSPEPTSPEEPEDYSPRRNNLSILPGIIAGLLVIAGASAVYFYFSYVKHKKETAETVNVIKEDSAREAPEEQTEEAQEEAQIQYPHAESYEEYDDNDDYAYAGSCYGHGTINGYPFRLEGGWYRDGSVSGTYINEHNGTRLSFRGHEADGVLKIKLSDNAGTFYLNNDGTGTYEGEFTKGNRSMPAYFSLD